MNNCPTCGQPLPAVTTGTRADELLSLVTRKADALAPKKWIGERPHNWRMVYRGDKSASWHVTYSGTLPKHQPFTRADVDVLIGRGLLASAYPDGPGADDAFYPTDLAMRNAGR